MCHGQVGQEYKEQGRGCSGEGADIPGMRAEFTKEWVYQGDGVLEGVQ